MNTAPRLRSRLRAGAVLLPASVVALLAVWSLGGPAVLGSRPPADQASAASLNVSPGPTARDILLHVPGGRMTVTLDDTQAARAFAAMLPVRVVMDDPMGQAKTGQLPTPIDVTGSRRVFDPRVGELYYWAPSHTVAIFYDDLGQSVPSPGLVRLGVVNSGLSAISSGGTSFTVRIEPASGTLTLIGY